MRDASPASSPFRRRGILSKPEHQQIARPLRRARRGRQGAGSAPTKWPLLHAEEKSPFRLRRSLLCPVARSCACAELLHSLGELLGPGLKRVIDISPIVPLFSELPDDQKRKVPAMIGPLIWTLKPNLPSLPVILKLR